MSEQEYCRAKAPTGICYWSSCPRKEGDPCRLPVGCSACVPTPTHLDYGTCHECGRKWGSCAEAAAEEEEEEEEEEEVGVRAVREVERAAALSTGRGKEAPAPEPEAEPKQECYYEGICSEPPCESAKLCVAKMINAGEGKRARLAEALFSAMSKPEVERAVQKLPELKGVQVHVVQPSWPGRPQ